MKVCHITSVHPMLDGRIFEKECSSLAKHGYEVYIVGVGTNGCKNNVSFISAAEKKAGRIRRMLFVDKKVVDKALELNCDVYHLHDPELLQYAIAIKKEGHKVIFDSHEDIPRQIYSKNWIPNLLRKPISLIYEKKEKRICKQLDKVIVATSKIGEAFKKYGIDTTTIYNYPLLNDESVEERNRLSKIICFAGGLYESNGIIQLIDVVKEIEDVKLKLAGRFEPIVEKYFNDNKNDRMEYLGVLSHEEVRQLYNESSIGVVVDLPTGNNVDGLPIKLFEYMDAGLPIVTSKFPIRNEIFKEYECGKLVDPNNKEEYVDSIRYILNNEDYQKRCFYNGRRAVTEKYNWAIEEEKLIALYKEFENG